jgi:hypothetical protein
VKRVILIRNDDPERGLLDEAFGRVRVAELHSPAIGSIAAGAAPGVMAGRAPFSAAG